MIFPAQLPLVVSADPTNLLGLGCAMVIAVAGIAVIFDYQRTKVSGDGFHKFMQEDSNEKAKEQWIRTMTFSCVKCSATFLSRDELIRHYDDTRHDKY